MWISVRKGLIWLLVATVAEVPTTVRLGSFSPLLFADSLFISQVLLFLNLNGLYQFIPSNPSNGC